MRSRFHRIWSDFLHALQFMTRLPVSRWVDYDSSAMPRCAFYFPLVGAVVGLSGALAYALAAPVFSDGLAVLAAMVVPVLLTGGLHEDGLADAADGLCGHASRDRALEIMRDSRIGSYGALALAFALAIRFVSIGEIGAPLDVLRVLVAAGVIGRACAVALLSTCPNARSSSLTSGPLSGGLSRSSLVWCLGYAMAVALFLLDLRIQPLVAAVLTTLALRQFFLRRLGGITGDCLGATIVLCELVVLVLATAR